MKTVKIKFSGFGDSIAPDKNFITEMLRRYYDVKICDDPDYLFFTQSSKDYLDHDCVRVFYTPENIVPDFNIADYAIGYQHLTYQDRYIRFPVYLVDGYSAYEGDDYKSSLRLAGNKHEISDPDKFLEGKKDFCSFVYSNHKGNDIREKFMEYISSYKRVDSGGKYKNNVGGPVKDKLGFQSTHKFAIAFENSSSSGYTTEKLVHAFAAGTVPVYWGDPDVDKVFNTDAFIVCKDNSETSFRSVLDRMIELDNDDDKYLDMIRKPAFRDDYSVDDELKKMEDFLHYIFGQEKEEAYRRNRCYWGERYERKQRIGNRVYWLLAKGIPVRDKIRTLLRR